MIEECTEATPPFLDDLVQVWHQPETRYRAQRYKAQDHEPCTVVDCTDPAPEKYWFHRYRICGTCWHKVEATKPWSRDDCSKKPKRYLAPGYAFIIPVLMEKARPLGYAIAVHGSMNRDLDVIAVPWVWDAVPSEVLVYQLTQSCTPFYQTDEDGEYIKEVGAYGYHTFLNLEDCREQPHGRKTWLIQLRAGCRIDISVLPLRPELNPFL